MPEGSDRSDPSTETGMLEITKMQTLLDPAQIVALGQQGSLLLAFCQLMSVRCWRPKHEVTLGDQLMVQQRQHALPSAAWRGALSLGHKAVPWAVQHMA